ncbi:sensor domain-containing diguanylate cyclase [Shewanella aestuarii]|uniref:diguanylate cyclase n=1 Tax=Shewanella aestuarii TaxID=1028752 RepID=A0A6G9QKS5_9GAMM|nr:GGDEF domain-containing protein [Shewanella aestuarii]QIR14998.1 GGDEF domain-containing protein [Shewanella aestuarii]
MHTDKFADSNNFYSGHIVTDCKRKIYYCNDYIADLSCIAKNAIVNTSISQHISKASNIFLDSYVYPILITEFTVEEIQMTWIDKHGKKIPIVANIKLGPDSMTYWSIYVCINRDKLQNELLNTNEYLEKLSNDLTVLATTDSLTGLLNRRELKRQAEKAIYQASINQSSFALLFIDIDLFKKINDSFGHQMGDKVIITLAQRLKDMLRENDILARIGGEEFVLILTNIDPISSYKLAERLREKVSDSPINGISVTVSIGLAVCEDENLKDFDKLLQRADKALYEAKKSGRNRVFIAN